MHMLSTFDVHLADGTVTIDGSARPTPRADRPPYPDEGAVGTVAFRLTLRDRRELSALLHAFTDPLETRAAFPVRGFVVFDDDEPTPISAISIRAYVTWLDQGEPTFRLSVDAFDDDLEPCDVPEDWAWNLLDVGAAEWSAMRREIRRACEAGRG